MQFSTVAIAAASVAAVSATVVTVTDVSSTLATITSCGSEVTNCPANSHSSTVAASNYTSTANVSTYEGAANKQFAAGAVALAAGALLAFSHNFVFFRTNIEDTSMSIDDEQKAFHFAVYSAVAQIPSGHVTSYGHIAYLIGRPQNSRHVGSSLKNLSYLRNVLNNEGASLGEIPWWRVINSAGMISQRNSGEYEQASLLRQEGVVVSEKHRINLEEYGWFPDEIEV